MRTVKPTYIILEQIIEYNKHFRQLSMTADKSNEALREQCYACNDRQPASHSLSDSVETNTCRQTITNLIYNLFKLFQRAACSFTTNGSAASSANMFACSNSLYSVIRCRCRQACHVRLLLSKYVKGIYLILL